jgi:hypothetical protein
MHVLPRRFFVLPGSGQACLPDAGDQTHSRLLRFSDSWLSSC